jgi:F0F1-type ATP synthase assembly protein I
VLADDWAHPTPALTFVGLLVGVALAVLAVVVQVRKYL